MWKAVCKRATGDGSSLQICCDEGTQDSQEELLVHLNGAANWPMAELINTVRFTNKQYYKYMTCIQV